MSYIVFARKWRPQTFDEIVGQAHVATTLKNAIKLNRIGQAYLFAGPRGVGKTSTARILAKALNCQKGPVATPCSRCANCVEIAKANSLDVIEIDGASNRGIDEIRNLRDNVKLSPAQGRYKIYIIDEVHQITEPAFNALLKTLEEPPAHVKFIFATTQPRKIPSTILSRCQRFDFKRIPVAQIVSKLKSVAKEESIDAAESVFFEIARASDGSMRDAESILDQLNSFCESKIEIKDVTKILGVVEEDLLLKITELISKKDLAPLLKTIDALTTDGRDLFQFLLKLIEHIRNLSILKINKNLSSMILVSDDTLKKLIAQADSFSLEDLIYCFYLLSSSFEASKRTGLVRFMLEFSLIKIVRREGVLSIENLLEKIQKINPETPVSLPVQSIPAPVKDETPQKKNTKPDNPEPKAVSKSSGNLSLDEVKRVWSQAVTALIEKKPSLASFLQEGQVQSVDGDVIKIGLPKIHRFHKEILEKNENKKIVEAIFKDVLKTQVRTDFTLVEKMQANRGSILDNETIDEAGNEDPVIKDALDVFKGSVVKHD